MSTSLTMLESTCNTGALKVEGIAPCVGSLGGVVEQARTKVGSRFKVREASGGVWLMLLRFRISSS